MKDLCDERRETINGRISKNESRIDKHGERIDSLEQSRAGSDMQMKHLIKEVSNLVSTMKWFMALSGTTLLGFFIWYIQSL